MPHHAGHFLYHLSGVEPHAVLQCLHYALPAQQFAVDIACLGQAIGIEKECGAWSNIHFLHLVWGVGEYTYRQMGIGRNFDRFSVPGGKKHGKVVTGIAIAQMAQWKVEHPDKEGDKDIERVALAGNTIDVLQDAARIALIGRSHSELGMDYRHNQSRGHAFATHITDAEKEFFVADKEVEKVSPNLFGGYQLTVYVQIVTVGEWRIVLGNHIPLYVLSHTQLAVYALILQPGLVQMNKCSCRTPKDVT